MILAGPDLDAALAAVENEPAVFLIHLRQGQPYLGRTSVLRRRLLRLLGPRDTPSRMLHLRNLAERVEWWPTRSRLASFLIYYDVARRYFPDSYRDLLKFRIPSFVRVLRGNEFPRTLVTSRLSGGDSFFFGPFRSRASAEKFEQDILDLFQIRRCQEDLVPSATHPGCIYGEMNRCLRPCQLVVGQAEYSSEVTRFVHFLDTAGESLMETIRLSRDRLSQELQFEDAHRQHLRLERIQQILQQRDELAAPLQKLNGVAVTPSPETGHVELRFFEAGVWHPSVSFRVDPGVGEMIPLDRRLREIVTSLASLKSSWTARQEQTAILTKWYYSSWRDGEWIAFPSRESVPYRRLVRAISRVAHSEAPPGTGDPPSGVQ
jgi:excinuclease ABC subunit C